MTRTMPWCSMVAALAACAGPPDRTAVGVVEASGAYVGIVSDGDEFVAYVCDGEDAAVWFEGPVEAGVFVEENERGVIDGVVAPDAIRGTFTAAGGVALSYVAADVGGDPEGLWRVEETIDGAMFLGGWVLAPDASQRGALLELGTGIVDRPALNVTDRTSSTIVGTLAVRRILSPRDVRD